MLPDGEGVLRAAGGGGGGMRGGGLCGAGGEGGWGAAVVYSAIDWIAVAAWIHSRFAGLSQACTFK